MTDAEKDASIRQFLSKEIDNLAEGAIAFHKESGRGLWVADLSAGPRNAQYRWVTQGLYAEHVAQGAFPPDVADAVTELIEGYDPRREFVLLVVHPDGSDSWQIVGHAPIGRG